MSLSSLSIRRPVLAVVLSLTILLFGFIGWQRLGVREYPSVDPPLITVSTNYRGANADVVLSQLTEPLEESVNGVAGIRTLTSTSREGRSTLQVEFELGTDLEQAANDVRDRVFRILGDLPPDVEPPEVSKADADSSPIVMMTVWSPQRNLLELSRLAEDQLVERLQTIAGVSRVDIWGSKEYAMRLWIDPQRLAAYHLSPLDVRDAVARENVELPSGRIEGQEVELSVRTMGRLNTPQAFEDLIIKESEGRLIRLKDVARVELGPRNERTVLKRNGTPMVAVVVRPQPGANYVEISDEVRRRLPAIEKNLPPDLQIDQGFDVTNYIRQSISEVQQTVFVSMLLVVLVIFLFLRDWRTTLIPVLAIPVSLVGAFFVMYIAGYSINVLTLLAIVLAIGLVVDDAIVVLENIYAKIEGGREPKEAGIVGTQEIFFAVIATTVALVAVLLPLLFLGGLTGRLFREFGVTLAGAVCISSFVALTLTSMLSTRLLKRRQKHSRFYEMTEPFFRRLARSYRESLTTFLRMRWVAFLIILACGGLIYLLDTALPSELAPLEDRSNLRLSTKGPEGATFEYMERYMDELESLVALEVPERRLSNVVVSPGFGPSSSVNSGFLRLYLRPPELRGRSQAEIAGRLSEAVRSLPGARTVVFQEPTVSVGRRSSQPVQFVLQAPNLEDLKEALPRFMESAGRSPVFSDLDVDLVFDKPELQVDIDRERARDLGVSALTIGQTLQLALAEQRLGFFVLDGKQYEVIGQVERGLRDETVDLRNLYVPSSSGEPVLLDKLVRLREVSSPPQLYRFDRYLAATVSAGLAPGYTLSAGIDEMERIADETLDERFSTSLSGQSRDFAESASGLAWVFVLALVLTFLVLAAQFESFRDPLIIMGSVPLALTGALIALWAYGQTLNLFSQIGMIMLVGLTTKNGILIVELANQRKAAGRTVEQAVLDAAADRFRPVLMTSSSTVLGILPLALALGAGSESRVPMGLAVIGGMILGTFLTLYVVPALYTYMTSRAQAEPQPEEERIDVAA
ncbi:MAG: efflux RND transporter permease subunit [Acidobacteria bacterium]|nr:efflux RND transporter permease subunit [Acidobacteriota bacterium]